MKSPGRKSYQAAGRLHTRGASGADSAPEGLSYEDVATRRLRRSARKRPLDAHASRFELREGPRKRKGALC